MAYDSVTELTVDVSGLQADAKTAESALADLENAAGKVGQAIRDAFTVSGYKDYLKTVRRFGKELADELLVLQLSFGRMKHAIADALAPIASLLVPVLNQAISAVTRFAGTLAELLRGLFQGISGQDALAQSAESAAGAEEKLEQAAVSAGKAVKRSLMGFDQLNRLSGASGSGGSSSGVWEELTGKIPDTVSPQVQAMVDRILAAIEPLRRIDMGPLKTALESAGAAFAALAEACSAGLGWVWQDLLIPFIRWGVEELGPVLTSCFAAKLHMITQAISPVIAGMAALHQALQPVIAYIGRQVLAALEGWRQTYEVLALILRDRTPQITMIFENLTAVVRTMWQRIEPVMNAISSVFTSVFQGVSQVVGSAAKLLIDSFSGITTFLAGAFTGNWKQAWEGLKSYLKGVVNGIIGLLNTMLSRFGSAINSVINGANKLEFTIPQWVPVIGGKSYGLNLSQVKIPQLPYLAQGAVLPANRPFMAVVGDQRHGTNIEAPLATIEEAVAGVMGDFMDGNMAGHGETVAVLREILQAVLGIRIGDDMIAQAASRYEQKMRIMKGV